MSVCHISNRPLGIDYIRGSFSKERASVCVTLSELTALWNPDTVKSVYSSQSAPMPFITWGASAPILYHARTHIHIHTHGRQERACFHGPVHFFWIANLIPQKLRIMCSKWAQHVFWIRFRCADDTDARAHRLITGLLPEQHRIVAAERRMRGSSNPEDFSRLTD